MIPSFPKATYRALVKRVVDGDTYELEVDLGFRVKRVMRIRLLGVNTPELRRGSDLEKQRGREARDHVEQLILNQWVLVHETNVKSFDRWVAEVEYWDGDEWTDLALHLLDARLAEPV